MRTLIWSVSLAVFFIEIWLANRLDGDEEAVRLEKKPFYLFATILLPVTLSDKGIDGFAAVGAAFFWGSLAAAAYSDWQIKKAYDFFFWVALAADLVILIGRETFYWACAQDLVIFSLLQILLFRKMYGAADCIGFTVCAAFFSAFGKGLFHYIFLMGCTFFLVFLVQAYKHNVNRKGNLKRPIALLPYIFFASVLFYII